jgi:hypothetical protein
LLEDVPTPGPLHRFIRELATAVEESPGCEECELGVVGALGALIEFGNDPIAPAVGVRAPDIAHGVTGGKSCQATLGSFSEEPRIGKKFAS